LPQKAIRTSLLDSILDPPNPTDELAIDIINFVDEVMDKIDNGESKEEEIIEVFHNEEILNLDILNLQTKTTTPLNKIVSCFLLRAIPLL
jgi:hypothetical protein